MFGVSMCCMIDEGFPRVGTCAMIVYSWGRRSVGDIHDWFDVTQWCCWCMMLVPNGGHVANGGRVVSGGLELGESLPCAAAVEGSPGGKMYLIKPFYFWSW